jgi:VanZ family protein
MKARTIARLAAWLVLAIMVALTIGPPRLRPVTWLPHSLEHFVAFVAVGAAFGLAYARHRLAIALAGIPYLAALELSQLFVTGRHASRTDLLVNIAGLCAGLAVTALAERWKTRDASIARP